MTTGGSMTRVARTLAALTACLTLTTGALISGCGLLPAAPGTLAAADQSCNAHAVTFAIGPDDIDWLTPIIASWNQAHPGTRVQALYLPAAANGQLAQLVADLQAKSCLYDIIDMDVVWTLQFASSGWIIPLDGFPVSGFLKPSVETAIYKGHQYAVPYYANADLLYYRTDIVKRPPKTWAELAADARNDARPKRGLYGYAATLGQYEGLTVNFAEAVQAEGGSILSPDGSKVTVDSWQAQEGLSFLVNGIRDKWIPALDLGYEELQAQQAFLAGKFVFLNNWPDVYPAATTPGLRNKVYGKVGVAALPGPSTLGGANLAISAYSRHQQAARAFIEYLTDPANERAMFVHGGFPPALASLYDDPALRASYPYLAVLKQSIQDALPRPMITNYAQASLAISGAVYQALRYQALGQPEAPGLALGDLQAQLSQLISGT
jgi:multiple sugar transport system substrate-binding protein